MVSHSSIGQTHNCLLSSYTSLGIALVSKYCVYPDIQSATSFFDVLLWGQKMAGMQESLECKLTAVLSRTDTSCSC